MRQTRYKAAGGGDGGAAVVEWVPHGADEPAVGALAAVDDLLIVSGVTCACGSEIDFLLIGFDNVGCACGANVGALAAELATATVGGQASINAAVEATQSVGCDVSSLQFRVRDPLAAKDVWVPTAAGCADDANKNGTDLQLAAAANDIYVAWDLSSFPASATVTQAILRFSVRTAHTSATQNASVFKIAPADEGWGEATLVCSNRPPADGASITTIGAANLSSTGEKSATLSGATATSHFTSRMGTTSATLLIQTGAANVGTCVWEAKDEGTNDAAGPRIDLTFTVPV